MRGRGEPAGPDCLGNRASMAGHLAKSVGPPGLGSTSGPSNQASRANWAICAFSPVQPTISASNWSSTARQPFHSDGPADRATQTD